MYRFFVRDIDVNSPEITITGDEASHLNRVLRLLPGEIVEVYDGRGTAFRAQITRSDPVLSRVRLLEAVHREDEADTRLILAQALVKGERMDFVLQKGTELGVHTFLPTVCQRSIVRLGKEKEDRKRERWQRIVLEATKQCGRTIVPRVKSVTGLGEVLHKYWKRGTPIIFPYEGEKELGLQTVLHDIFHNKRISTEILVIVGPEGGFELDEVKLAAEYGAKIVSLGPRVLRTETAALAVITMILYEGGDLGTIRGD